MVKVASKMEKLDDSIQKFIDSYEVSLQKIEEADKKNQQKKFSELGDLFDQ